MWQRPRRTEVEAFFSAQASSPQDMASFGDAERRFSGILQGVLG
jgi:hypothetical protein